MAYVNLVDPSTATGTTAEHLSQIKGAFGMVPNMFKVAANSPVDFPGVKLSRAA